MLSFTAVDHARVAAGELTVTWRLWKYAHVKPGRAYSTGFGFVQIEDVRQVRVADVTDEDAREAGCGGAAALVELARSHSGAVVSPETLLYRVQFRYLPDAPESARPALTMEDLTTRLARLDLASRHGDWTEETLRLLEANPRAPARVLAAEVSRPLADFKADVRTLKGLGLTVSLDVGYELSESGQEYLDSRAGD